MYQGPGRYRHYKGGEYEVLGLGVHEHAKDHQPNFDPELRRHQFVVYRPLTPGGMLDRTTVSFWLRDLKDFNEFVGEEPRFLFLRDEHERRR